LKINLHLHSRFSDGQLSISEIVQEALKNKFRIVTITDHFTNSWKANVIPSLDTKTKITKYLNKIENERKRLKLKDSNLIVLKGIEIDLGSTKDFILNLVNPQKFDLILFEYLETLEGLKFCKDLIKKWNIPTNFEKTPIFGLAHFDPSNFLSETHLNFLITFLDENNVFYEFNTRYSEYYSTKNRKFFEKIQNRGTLVSIGSDAHNSSRINDLKSAMDMIEYYGLSRNLEKLINKILKYWTI